MKLRGFSVRFGRDLVICHDRNQQTRFIEPRGSGGADRFRSYRQNPKRTDSVEFKTLPFHGQFIHICAMHCSSFCLWYHLIKFLLNSGNILSLKKYIILFLINWSINLLMSAGDAWRKRGVIRKAMCQRVDGGARKQGRHGNRIYDVIIRIETPLLWQWTTNFSFKRCRYLVITLLSLQPRGPKSWHTNE